MASAGKDGALAAYAGLGGLIQARKIPAIVVTLGASFIWVGIGYALQPTPGSRPRYRSAGGDPPLRGSRYRAMRKPGVAPSSVPGILSPDKVTVKGAPAARRLLRNRRPLSGDLARQALGTYRKDRAERGVPKSG